jgi:hypothetical protein
MEFKHLYKLVGKLCYKLFPKAGAIEHITKLKQEADEVIETPKDIEEYADCLFALISASVKAGFTCDELINATTEKAIINSNRKWKEMPDGTHQHIRK